MKKIIISICFIFGLIVFSGAGCAGIGPGDREGVLPPEANINAGPEVPPEANINAPVDFAAGWETYRDEPWAIEMKYPPKYKTVSDTYGWPHALVHFIETAPGAQSYRAQIETWENEGDFRAAYGRDPAHIVEHPNGKNWVTVNYNALPSETALNEEWRDIISTFRFTAP